MHIKEWITTPLAADPHDVWQLAAPKNFAYSDGASVERYLRRAFTTVADLGSRSTELEEWIKDWPSEYHLSHKRAQLLQGFQFDRQAKVLEVGCGCGAITRFLGESFEHVLAVEGSTARAHLARLRTKDLPHVEIVCAPFQELNFTASFDIIFCIGVLEYAGSYVSAPDPYQHLLELFAKLLNPNGILLVAIENQFGLKYFTGAQEDHTGIRFEGLEGYPRRGGQVRTFGYQELHQRLRACFDRVNFFFPYPDYKLPDCVLTEEFLRTGKAGELVGLFPDREGNRPPYPLFDEKMTLLELDRNRQLPFFANSFLAVAGKSEAIQLAFPQLGILFNRNERLPLFQTVTRFCVNADNIDVHKTLSNTTQPFIQSGRLRCHPKREPWRNGLTLHTRMLQRMQRQDLTLAELFAPVRSWLDLINDQSRGEDGHLLVPGSLVDAVWHNMCVQNTKTTPHYIDQEWDWSEPIGRNTLIIRAIFRFLEEARTVSCLTSYLRHGSTRTIIRRIAEVLDISLSPSDFLDFIALEAELTSRVTGRPVKLSRRSIVCILAGNHYLFVFHRQLQRLRAVATHLAGRILARLLLFLP